MGGIGCYLSLRKLFMYSGIWFETLRKITNSLTQNSWSLGCNLNSEPPEYEAAGLPTMQPCCLELLR